MNSVICQARNMYAGTTPKDSPPHEIPKTNIAADRDLRGQRVQGAGLESSVKETRPVRLRWVIILRD